MSWWDIVSIVLAALIGMQYLLTWTSVRVPWVRKLVTGEPALLLYQGTILPEALRKARVTEDELYAAVREAGEDDLKDLRAVVLETDGEFSVLTQGKVPELSSLKGMDSAD